MMSQSNPSKSGAACSSQSPRIWRQAQIGHGSLVVLGCVIGWLVHPAGYAFAALVGAGAALSGITGYCGMREFMVRMPWNR